MVVLVIARLSQKNAKLCFQDEVPWFSKIRDLFLYSSCREGFPGTESTCVYLVYLFHQSFGQELIKRLNQARFHLKETLSHREKESRQSQANASLQRAQAMAKDILNLSQSDLEEIMSADGDQESMVCDSICMRFYFITLDWFSGLIKFLV